MSIFADVARNYHESGFSVMPVIGKDQPIEKGFQRFSKKMPTDEQISKWEEIKTKLNIGVILGLGGLVCLDIDYDGEDREAFLDGIKKLAPEILVAKKGKKGLSAFYRSSLPGRKIKHPLDKRKTVLEVLSTGNYTIVPPSIHSETKKPYVWLTENELTDVKVSELPELTKDDLTNFEIFVEDFFTNQPKHSGGRNISLGAHIFKVANKFSTFDELVKHIMAIDVEWFGDESYYNDPQERKQHSPEEFARQHVSRAVDWLKKKKEEKGESWSFKNQTELSIDAFLKSSGGFFHLSADGNVVPHYAQFAETLKRERLLISHDTIDYIYNGSYWESIGEVHFDNIIMQANKNKLKPFMISSFKKVARSICFEKSDGKGTQGLMNLNNGVLNVVTGELLQSSSKYFFTNKININYDEKADCPKWISFLDDVFSKDGELTALSQEIIGYTLLGGKPFLHKAFVLFGEGRNGKSTFIDVFRMLIGNGAASVSIKLLDKPFSVVSLDGKIANLVEETPSGELSSEAFKAAVGGGILTAAKKGKDEYDLRIDARFIFACNKIPTFDDKNESLMERLVFLPFKNFIPLERRDVFLIEKLKEELPGILNWAIEGARRVSSTLKLTEPTVSNNLMLEFREDNDNVYAWFIESIKVSTEYGDVTARSLYNRYCHDTRCNNQFPVKFIQFCKRFKKILIERNIGNFPVETKIKEQRGYNFVRYIGNAAVLP